MIWRMKKFIQEITDPIQCILIAYFGYLAAILICIIVRPDGLLANRGLSYYGGFLNTGFLSLFAYFWVALFFFQAAQILDREGNRHLRYLSICLRIMGVLIVCIGVTPHNILDEIHKIFGSALFILQLGVTFVFLSQKQSQWYRLTLVFIELASGIASAYYVPLEKGFLIEMQFIFQIAFGLLLINTLHYRNARKIAKIA